MDNTARARLETAAQGETGWAWVRAADVRALLAERDALQQEVRDLCTEIQEEREETTQVMIGWQHKAEAALAALARAAPVLAAAHGLAEDSEAYARGALTLEVWESARRTGVGRIVAAVRAAREGGG